MFSNRAEYSWGIDGQILWLKSLSDAGRSLTNDIENCLVEISPDLPKGKTLLSYAIMYRDSGGIWDRIDIESLDKNQLIADVKWLARNRQEKRGSYHSRAIKFEFYPISETEYQPAKEKLLAMIEKEKTIEQSHQPGQATG